MRARRLAADSVLPWHLGMPLERAYAMASAPTDYYRPGDVVHGSGDTFTLTAPSEPSMLLVSVRVGDGEPQWTAERLPDDPDERVARLAKDAAAFWAHLPEDPDERGSENAARLGLR